MAKIFKHVRSTYIWLKTKPVKQRNQIQVQDVFFVIEYVVRSSHSPSHQLSDWAIQIPIPSGSCEAQLYKKQIEKW